MSFIVLMSSVRTLSGCLLFTVVHWSLGPHNILISLIVRANQIDAPLLFTNQRSFSLFCFFTLTFSPPTL